MSFVGSLRKRQITYSYPVSSLVLFDLFLGLVWCIVGLLGVIDGFGGGLEAATFVQLWGHSLEACSFSHFIVDVDRKE